MPCGRPRRRRGSSRRPLVRSQFRAEYEVRAAVMAPATLSSVPAGPGRPGPAGSRIQGSLFNRLCERVQVIPV